MRQFVPYGDGSWPRELELCENVCASLKPPRLTFEPGERPGWSVGHVSLATAEYTYGAVIDAERCENLRPNLKAPIASRVPALIFRFGGVPERSLGHVSSMTAPYTYGAVVGRPDRALIHMLPASVNVLGKGASDLGRSPWAGSERPLAGDTRWEPSGELGAEV